MSDSHHYFLAHAREAIEKARNMPPGPVKEKQRTVARVCHLLAKEAAYPPRHHYSKGLRKSSQAGTSNRKQTASG